MVRRAANLSLLLVAESFGERFRSFESVFREMKIYSAE
jgi:hypothetical protein